MIRTSALAAMAALAVATSAAARDATAIADLRRGSAVTVVGTVDRILDSDEFRLVDPSGSVVVYVGPNRMPASVGETVTVRGVVDDDVTRPEIYARELVRADGSVVRFATRYE